MSMTMGASRLVQKSAPAQLQTHTIKNSNTRQLQKNNSLL